MMNPLKAFTNPTLMGTITSKSTRKTKAPSYIKGKKNAIAKRRAKNKVARKSRRYNRLHASSKHCKFYKRG